MPTLEIKIIAGRRTCTKEPGAWCRFLRARCDGSEPYCALFGVLLWDQGSESPGWLQRCSECLEAESDGARLDPVTPPTEVDATLR